MTKWIGVFWQFVCENKFQWIQFAGSTTLTGWSLANADKFSHLWALVVGIVLIWFGHVAGLWKEFRAPPRLCLEGPRKL